jgi:hypothetical protein
METDMQNVSKKIRARIAQVMSNLQAPSHNLGQSKRADGVLEFSKRWIVSGNADTGVTAYWTDWEDVIEFGLTERDQEPRNLLHVTIVINGEQEAEFSCISVEHSRLNVHAALCLGSMDPLERALEFFALNVVGEVV